MKRLLKPFLIAAGSLSVVVGVIGIFVPLLPTTPFLLLAAACYARSSVRLYRWLHENRWFGAYVTNYRAGRGMPRHGKVAMIAAVWIVVGVSIVVVDSLAARLVLVAVVFGVTLHVLRLPRFDATSIKPSSGRQDLHGYSSSS